MSTTPNKPMRDLFVYFRQAWGPRAAYHLARVRHGERFERFASRFWLAAEGVPYSGAAPSMSFPGLGGRPGERLIDR